jgi:hypothetical protein
MPLNPAAGYDDFPNVYAELCVGGHQFALPGAGMAGMPAPTVPRIAKTPNIL